MRTGRFGARLQRQPSGNGCYGHAVALPKSSFELRNLPERISGQVLRAGSDRGKGLGGGTEWVLVEKNTGGMLCVGDGRRLLWEDLASETGQEEAGRDSGQQLASIAVHQRLHS